MTEAKPPKSGTIKVLKSEVRSDLAVAKRLSAEVSTLFLSKASPRPDETLYATALLLHHFYSALEAAFERIGKVLDGDIPSGSDWHRQLLHRMGLNIEGLRPAVLPESLIPQLDEYRGFRHVVRHAYESQLQESRLQLLVERLPTVTEAIHDAVQTFATFLDELASGLE